MNLVDESKDLRELTKFYEKQTNIISNRVDTKIKDIEIYLINKQNTSRLLRIEIHSNIKKIRHNNK